MPTVLPTALTTDYPGDPELTVCDGFAMFPWLGAARVAVDVNKATGTFFEKTINLELFQIDMGAFHSVFIGVCGPAYAVDMDTDAETRYFVPDQGQPATGTLVLDDNFIQGGFQYGIDFQIDIDLTVTLNLIFKKKKLVNVDENIDIDVISLAIDLIKYLLSGGGGGQDEGNPNELEMSTFSDADSDKPQIDEGTEGTGNKDGEEGGKGVRPEFSGFGMLDYLAEPWVPPPNQPFNGTPSGQINPQIGFNFSLVPLFADIPFLDILYGLDEALEAIGGGFGFGPGLSIGLPTTVTLKGATISNHPFDVTKATNLGSGDETTTEYELSERTPIDPHLQPLGDTADEIGALLEHKVGIEIGLYFFVDMTFFKVINIGAQTGTLPLIDVPLPPAAGGPFENQLSFIPGGGAVPFGAPDTAPTVGPYTANQPQGRWKDGVLAQYGVSFFSDVYESPIGPFSGLDPKQRFFAFPQISNIETGPLVGDGDQIQGRKIYRLFNDGSPVELVGTIDDNSTTTFTDTKP